MEANHIQLLIVLSFITILFILIFIGYILNRTIRSKRKIQERQFLHEIQLKELELKQKIDWDKYLTEKVREKETNQKQNSLPCQEQNQSTPPIKAEQAALFHLLLSKYQQPNSSTLKSQLEEIKKSYELIEPYLKK